MNKILLVLWFFLGRPGLSATIGGGGEDVTARRLASNSVDTTIDNGCHADDEGNDEHDAATRQIRDQFNEEGYVVLKNFFTNDNKSPTTTNACADDDDTAASASSSPSLQSLLRRDWYNFSVTYWNRIFTVLHERGHISQPHHVMNDEYTLGKLRQPGYKEIVHRFPGRYELSLPPPVSQSTNNNNDKAPPSSSSSQLLLYHDMPALQPIIDQLEPVILSILQQHPDYQPGQDGTKYNLLQSMLISAPESQSQKFHIDTKHLNENDDEHLPAHIINVFIPLMDIDTKDLGPTEVVPQSHVETRLMYNPRTRHQAKAMFELPKPVAPLMAVGDVLLFDFRTLHRGLANVDARHRNRPVLVLAFSLPSFHDTANWPGPSIFD